MKNQICNHLTTLLPETAAEQLMEFLEIPPESTMGDFALPCFAFAKSMRKNPKLIAEELAAEDELCAEYIKSILDGKDLPNMDERVADLQFHGGEHFFNPDTQEVFPEPDFWMCIKYDRFPYVLEISKDEIGYMTKRIR